MNPSKQAQRNVLRGPCWCTSNHIKTQSLQRLMLSKVSKPAFKNKTKVQSKTSQTAPSGCTTRPPPPTWLKHWRTNWMLCYVRFCEVVHEVKTSHHEKCFLLAYWAPSRDNLLLTFRDILSVPFKGPKGCPEALVRNYRYSRRNSPEECSSYLIRDGSPKQRNLIMTFSPSFP